MSSSTDVSAVMVTHWLLSSAMRISDGSDWPVHSLMLINKLFHISFVNRTQSEDNKREEIENK